MSGGQRHYNHVIRVLGLFAGGFTLFIIVRFLLVPADFGVYGFYRAGALDDARGKEVKFASSAVCVDCHTDVAKERGGSRHENLSCQACHGPLKQHSEGHFEAKPDALNPRLLCLKCHTTQAGLPKDFPNINPKDHMGDGPCTDCHKPHHPKIG